MLDQNHRCSASSVEFIEIIDDDDDDLWGCFVCDSETKTSEWNLVECKETENSETENAKISALNNVDSMFFMVEVSFIMNLWQINRP
jgi:hypothetical protein